MSSSMRIQLRTKIGDSTNYILPEDLSSRELAFENAESSIVYKDISGNVIKFFNYNGDETSTVMNWDSSNVNRYLDTKEAVKFNWLSSNVVDETNNPPETPTINDWYIAALDSTSEDWIPNHIYEWDSSWIDYSPVVGNGIFRIDNKYSYIYGSTTDWNKLTKAQNYFHSVPLFLNASSITTSDISGCSLPRPSLNIWDSTFLYGESGFWQMAIPSNCTYINKNVLYFSVDTTGIYEWTLDWFISENNNMLPFNNNYSGVGISISEDINNLDELIVLDFTSGLDTILANNENDMINLKLELTSAGESNSGIVKFYGMRIEYSNEEL